PAAPAPGACEPLEGVTLFVSPRSPRVGAPIRVLAVSEKAVDASLAIHDLTGATVTGSRERHGGPPFWWSAEIASAAGGMYGAALVRADGRAACKEIAVEVDPPADAKRAWGAAWGVRAAWDRSTEGLYSAWIERFFDAPLEEQLSWYALHEVLRDRTRNLLHD